MTHLMEEYPSVELPEEIKKRICQTYYQKKRLDAKLVARSQARNKAVDQVIFKMFERSLFNEYVLSNGSIAPSNDELLPLRCVKLRTGKSRNLKC